MRRGGLAASGGGRGAGGWRGKGWGGGGPRVRRPRTNEHHPLLIGRRLVVDDMGVGERRVAVKDLDGLRLACSRESHTRGRPASARGVLRPAATPLPRCAAAAAAVARDGACVRGGPSAAGPVGMHAARETARRAPSMDQWKTAAAVTMATAAGEIHFQKMTGSVTWCDFILRLISMLKICR